MHSSRSQFTNFHSFLSSPIISSSISRDPSTLPSVTRDNLAAVMEDEMGAGAGRWAVIAPLAALLVLATLLAAAFILYAFVEQRYCFATAFSCKRLVQGKNWGQEPEGEVRAEAVQEWVRKVHAFKKVQM